MIPVGREGAEGKRTVAFAVPDDFALSGVNIWSAELGRHLRGLRCAPVLLCYPSPTLPVNSKIYLPEFLRTVRCELPGWGRVSPSNTAQYRALLPACIVPNYSQESFAICAEIARTDPNRIRVIGMCHADESFYFDTLSYFESMIHRFVVVSEECFVALRQRIPHRANDIVFRPYGVEIPRKIDRPPLNSQAPLRLLYAGRIVERQKRVLDLLRLAAELSSRNVDFRLQVVGEGTAWSRLAQALVGLPEWARARVALESRVAHERMPELLGAADVAVLVSAFEGTSLFMLEGMAHGCVPAVTAVSGTRTFVDHMKTGLRVEVGDMKGLADGVAMLAQDRNLLQQMSEAARTRVKPHSIESYAEWFASLSQQLWTEPPRPWPANQPTLPRYQRFLGMVGHYAPFARVIWRRLRSFYQQRFGL